MPPVAHTHTSVIVACGIKTWKMKRSIVCGAEVAYFLLSMFLFSFIIVASQESERQNFIYYNEWWRAVAIVLWASKIYIIGVAIKIKKKSSRCADDRVYNRSCRANFLFFSLSSAHYILLSSTAQENIKGLAIIILSVEKDLRSRRSANNVCTYIYTKYL